MIVLLVVAVVVGLVGNYEMVIHQTHNHFFKIVYHLIWLRIKITLSFCCCPRQNVIVRLHPGVGFFLLEVLPLKKD